MKLKDMPIEELEILSYTDMTQLIIKEKKKPMNTPSLFREISNLLGYSDEEYSAKIGDYYTALNNDKRFVLLEDNTWDIRDNQVVETMIDEDDEVEDEEEQEVEEEMEPIEEDDDNIDEVIDDDIDDDDIEELTIVEEDEVDEEE